MKRRALIHWVGREPPSLDQIPVGMWAECSRGEGWGIYAMIEPRQQMPMRGETHTHFLDHSERRIISHA